MKKLFALLVLILIPFISPAQRPMTPTDKAMLRMPSSPRLSPDGARAAFTIREADTTANAWRTQVYVVDVKTRAVTQVTQSDASCSDPAWSPDGSRLCFLSSRPFINSEGARQEGVTALFSLPADGGEATVLAVLEKDIDSYVWSPDGKRIALLTEGDTPAEFLDEEQRREERKLNITVNTDPVAGKQLWMVDVAHVKVHKVRDLDAGAEGISWFPSGDRLLYQTNYTGAYNDEQKWDLWAVTLDGKTEQLTSMPGPESKGRVSPDGRFVACITQTVPDIEFAKTEISILNMDTRQFSRLTANAEYSVEDFRWNADGSAIIALFNERTSAVLARVDPGSGALQRLTDPALVIRDFDLNARGDAAFIAAVVDGLDELHLLDRKGTQTLTNYSEQLKPFIRGEQKVITVRSRDGLYDIDAVLVLPAGYRKGTRVPLLLAYHGGPYGDFDNRFLQYYPAHILAAKGWATVMPNVRGSSGYSDAFGQANRFDLGGGDYRDAMDVVDWLIAQGIADSSHMAVTGGSYGGYMTNWTISQTPRFKSAVSMYGIFSWFTDWSNSWQPAFEVMFLGHNYWEKPLDEKNPWINRAPQTYVRNIVTPTLILQGDKDQYTNISNSREMYQALKELGRNVEFVVYHGAGHGLRTFPNQWIDSMERTVAWITGPPAAAR
ncbi:MAG: S9 family peptidase [Bacteroidetes bacterium]|nr:S9 family peptidase [Bacteroidota bacterium]